MDFGFQKKRSSGRIHSVTEEPSPSLIKTRRPFTPTITQQLQFKPSSNHCYSVRGQCVGSAWAVRGQCVGSAWAVRGQCVGSAWAVRGQCVGSAWAVRGQCVGSAWAVRGQSNLLSQEVPQNCSGHSHCYHADSINTNQCLTCINAAEACPEACCNAIYKKIRTQRGQAINSPNGPR